MAEREVRWFFVLSITAGVCEEILYRGHLIWYLHHAMPLWSAALLASAIFGSAHAYQGLAGIPRTGLVGLLMAALYMFAGSLLLPMILHALVDINGGLMGMAVFTRHDNAADAPPDASASRTVAPT